jgi:hypothetical protein
VRAWTRTNNVGGVENPFNKRPPRGLYKLHDDGGLVVGTLTDPEQVVYTQMAGVVLCPLCDGRGKV